MARIVVLVLTWNGKQFLQPCLAALLEQQGDLDYGVLVVDNASSDGSVQLVRNSFPQVALITNAENLGFAAGNNVGLRALLAGDAPPPCDGVPEIVVLLNQDTVVDPDWLSSIVEVFERRPDAGIVGCKMLNPGGDTIQHGGGQLVWPTAAGMHRGMGEPDQGQYDQEEPVAYVAGAAMAIRRGVLEQIGLFDEGFTPAYYEDTDLCFRARAAGYEVLYTPQARLVHYEGTSLTLQSAAHQRVYHRNRIRFVLKHASPDLFRPFLLAEHEELLRWSLATSGARKQAYLDGLLALPGMVAQRASIGTGQVPEAEIIEILRTLHQAAVREEHLRRAELVVSPSEPEAKG